MEIRSTIPWSATATFRSPSFIICCRPTKRVMRRGEPQPITPPSALSPSRRLQPPGQWPGLAAASTRHQGENRRRSTDRPPPRPPAASGQPDVAPRLAGVALSHDPGRARHPVPAPGPGPTRERRSDLLGMTSDGAPVGRRMRGARQCSRHSPSEPSVPPAMAIPPRRPVQP